MARKIIIQERINEPSDFSFKFVFWADVPAARQALTANPTASSVVKDITPEELLAIQNGSVVELQDSANYVASTPIAAIQTDLINRFNAFQAKINATNPWKFYGTSWDGVAWSVKQTS